MAKQLILENDYMAVYYFADEKVVHHVLQPGVGGEALRDGLNMGIRLLAENGAQKWLSDDRLSPGLNEEDTVWAFTEWFDNALRAGWKFWALVVPDEVMARLNMAQFVDEAFQRGVRVQVFTDLDLAWDWLLNQ